MRKVGFILNEKLFDEKNTIDKPLVNLIKKSGKSLTKIGTKTLLYQIERRIINDGRELFIIPCL